MIIFKFNLIFPFLKWFIGLGKSRCVSQWVLDNNLANFLDPYYENIKLVESKHCRIKQNLDMEHISHLIQHIGVFENILLCLIVKIWKNSVIIFCIYTWNQKVKKEKQIFIRRNVFQMHMQEDGKHISLKKTRLIVERFCTMI